MLYFHHEFYSSLRHVCSDTLMIHDYNDVDVYRSVPGPGGARGGGGEDHLLTGRPHQPLSRILRRVSLFTLLQRVWSDNSISSIVEQPSRGFDLTFCSVYLSTQFSSLLYPTFLFPLLDHLFQKLFKRILIIFVNLKLRKLNILLIQMYLGSIWEPNLKIMVRGAHKHRATSILI